MSNQQKTRLKRKINGGFLQESEIVKDQGGDEGLGGEGVSNGQLHLLNGHNAEGLAGVEVGVVEEVKELENRDLG
jgi:hypothetical protein